MKNLAIIPARGGSKRIPKKNIRDFLGKPIIAYSIEVAIESGLFDEIMVSTDDEEIAEVSKKYGASVPFKRSAKTSDDFATINDVLKEVIETYLEINKNFDNMCCILPTAPLITSKMIVSAYTKLMSSNCSIIYPIVAFSYPILRSLKINNDGTISMNWPEYVNTRSQDLAIAYHDSGTFYWYKIDLWKKGISKSLGIIVDDISVQDIDNEQDWELAELKYLMNSK
jgi:pseudaminic acid cytidylyltransferase